MLRLVRISEADLELIMNWRMSPEITKYMYTDPMLTLQDQIKWYKNIISDHTCRYWIIMNGNDKIGVINLTDIDNVNKKCTCGYYIAEPSYRGKGLAKVIEYNIYDYVFNAMELNKLYFEVLSFNVRALLLHKKCGCTIEGILKQHIKKGVTYFDVVVFGILKEHWLNVKSAINYPTIHIEEYLM